LILTPGRQFQALVVASVEGGACLLEPISEIGWDTARCGLSAHLCSAAIAAIFNFSVLLLLGSHVIGSPQLRYSISFSVAVELDSLSMIYYGMQPQLCSAAARLWPVHTGFFQKSVSRFPCSRSEHIGQEEDDVSAQSVSKGHAPCKWWAFRITLTSIYATATLQCCC